MGNNSDSPKEVVVRKESVNTLSCFCTLMKYIASTYGQQV